MKEKNNIFEKHSVVYTPMLTNFSQNSDKTRFHIFSAEYIVESMKQNYQEGNYFYCVDALENTRLSAATGLLRSYRWLQGINEAYFSSNYIIFCAGLRGFLLSAADNRHSLSRIPGTLADNANLLHKLLSKNADDKTLYSLEALESIFEHFLLARKQRAGESLSPDHRAKQDAEYIREWQGGNSGQICDCYAELCEITHPASASVFSFIEENLTDSNKETGTFLRSKLDSTLIADFCQKYSNVIPKVFETAFNPSLLALGLLNLMKDDFLFTSAINSYDLNFMPKWVEYKTAIVSAFGNT